MSNGHFTGNFAMDRILEVVKPHNDRMVAEARQRRAEKQRDDLLAALLQLRHHSWFDEEGDLTRSEFDAMLARADAAIEKVQAQIVADTAARIRAAAE
jgi:hypothetical protein